MRKLETWEKIGIVAGICVGGYGLYKWMYPSCVEGTTNYVEIQKTTEPERVPGCPDFCYLRYYDQKYNIVKEVGGCTIETIIGHAEGRHGQGRLTNTQLRCVYNQSKKW